MIEPRPPWSGLLVSVRDEDEAEAAMAGGAAIVDVKEPSRGPLGAADDGVVGAIGSRVAGRLPWTVAAGELNESGCDERIWRLRLEAWSGSGSGPPAGVKVGPAGVSDERWRLDFRRFAAALPAGTHAIAVAYADWERAAAPPPEAIIAAASATPGCRVLLVDTFDKHGPPVFAAAGRMLLARWLADARAAGLTTAIAGRISPRSLPLAAGLGADVVAVRGAACPSGRRGAVCGRRVAELRAKLDRLRSPDGRYATIRLA